VLDVWDALKRQGRPQPIFREMLCLGLEQMILQKKLPAEFLRVCQLRTSLPQSEVVTTNVAPNQPAFSETKDNTEYVDPVEGSQHSSPDVETSEKKRAGSSQLPDIKLW